MYNYKHATVNVFVVLELLNYLLSRSIVNELVLLE